MNYFCQAEIKNRKEGGHKTCAAKAVIAGSAKNGGVLAYCKNHKSRASEYPNKHNGGFISIWKVAS